jgi:hypothetical protein
MLALQRMPPYDLTPVVMSEMEAELGHQDRKDCMEDVNPVFSTLKAGVHADHLDVGKLGFPTSRSTFRLRRGCRPIHSCHCACSSYVEEHATF